MNNQLRRVGFPISHKEMEYRRVVIPEHMAHIKNRHMLYLEKGYGEVLGYSDSDYKMFGCNIEERKNILQCDIICDPKVGDAEYIQDLPIGTTLFGWIHAVQNRLLTDMLIKNQLTAFAWENMEEWGRHVFWRNNELAGEAAILHAYQCYGIMPYNTKVAVIGSGNTARGAIKILTMLGANIHQYNRKTENLFKKEIGGFDVVVNCVLWDLNRKNHIIDRNDLTRMKKGALIIDVSCDKAGGIETSIPTTISNPIYQIDNIFHYAVDHTPSLFYRTFSEDNSKIICEYLDELITNKHGDVLENSKIMDNGKIIDELIIKFQNR